MLQLCKVRKIVFGSPLLHDKEVKLFATNLLQLCKVLKIVFGCRLVHD